MGTHNAIYDARGIDAGVFIEGKAIIAYTSCSIIVPNTPAVATTYTLVGDTDIRIACFLSGHKPWLAIDDLVFTSESVVPAITNTARISANTSVRADLCYAIQVTLSNAAIVDAGVIIEGAIVWVT